MAQSDTIQDQYAELRRSQILDAAAAVFAEKGFHRSTIKDVAKAAGVADGTIYNYFANKDALILGILDRINQTQDRESHFEQASQGTQADVAAWGQNYIKQRFEWLGEDGFHLFQVVLAEVLSNADFRKLYVEQVIEPTYGMAETYFQQWIDQGKLRKLDAALTMRAISGMFLGMLMLRIIGDPVLDQKWDAAPDIAAEIILRGILEDKHE
jgi:TetR/AcrR family fatty acid metabolism transcriptional regulator